MCRVWQRSTGLTVDSETGRKYIEDKEEKKRKWIREEKTREKSEDGKR